MLKAVIFDFDGVLAESNSAKEEAFEILFSRYPEHTENMRAYNAANRQKPRSEKFRYCIDQFFLQPGNGDLLREMEVQFADLVVGRVLASADVPGTRELLTRLQGKVSLYVSSVTPQVELIRIMEEKGLAHYFDGIYGNPPHPKIAAIAAILEAEGITPEEAVFVGDSLPDFEAASHCGVPFIGRRSEHAFEGEGFTLHDDLFAIAPLILERIR